MLTEQPVYAGQQPMNFTTSPEAVPPYEDLSQAAQDYQTVERAIRFLEENFRRQPSLSEVAAHVNLSEYHFQRLFSRWVGISPKRFLQYLTKEHAKQVLERSRSVLDVAYDVGLTGPGRLHDLLVTCEAVTPGEYKQRGAGLVIRYGFHPSPFGECLLGVTDRGICWLSFSADGGRERELQELQESWSAASFMPDDGATGPLVQRIFRPTGDATLPPLHLFVRGTNFQIKVWEALLRIPPGSILAYEDLARWLGRPTAARAVGNAVAHNYISYLIPCHRVLRNNGSISNYRWGSTRKRAILAWESAVTLG
jgi:AraC family transcriptional regulator of adaptative response/methylated-DNA-[protein]-cysteine methyltransferase